MMKMKIFCVVSSCLIISACAPRGESASLDEVLTTARTRYMAVAKEQIDAAMITKITDVAQKIDQLAYLKSDPEKEMLKMVGTDLAELLRHASYTSRPGLSELASQYEGLGNSNQKVTADQLKLLAARTYLALVSEVETGKFRL